MTINYEDVIPQKVYKGDQIIPKEKMEELDHKMTIAILFGDEFYDLELKQRKALEYLLFDLDEYEKAHILFNRYRGLPDNY